MSLNRLPSDWKDVLLGICGFLLFVLGRLRPGAALRLPRFPEPEDFQFHDRIRSHPVFADTTNRPPSVPRSEGLTGIYVDFPEARETERFASEESKQNWRRQTLTRLMEEEKALRRRMFGGG